MKDGILKSMGLHISSLESYQKFEKDLWNKHFFPNPIDLIETVPKNITQERRKTILRQMSLNIAYPSDEESRASWII